MNKVEYRYRKWGLKLLILGIIAIPCFNNKFVNLLSREIIEGLSQGQLLYFAVANTVIFIILGKNFLYISHSISTLIVISVVFFGSLISFIKVILKTALPVLPENILEYSPHYITLLVTMLTVVPLSISIISSVPFFQYERKVLRKMEGISFIRKLIIIQTRVFSNIIYYVIPKILLVMKEEKNSKKSIYSSVNAAEDIVLKKGENLINKTFNLINYYFQIGIAGIRLSLEFIPLWALEISQLPNKKEMTKIKEKK